MKVVAPNRRYCGNLGADQFYNGVCEHASEEHRDYYESAGYTILGDGDEIPKPAPARKPDPVKDDTAEDTADAVAETIKPPKHSATTAEWREFAAKMGLEVPEDAKRGEIIALYEQAIK